MTTLSLSDTTQQFSLSFLFYVPMDSGSARDRPKPIPDEPPNVTIRSDRGRVLKDLRTGATGLGH